MFHSQGKCSANHTDDLDTESPGELNNLDQGKKMSVGRAVQNMRGGTWSRSQRTSYLDQTLKRSNEHAPGRMFIDPYGATTGNLWAENYEMNRYQKGGQTSLAGRSSGLKMTPLVPRHMDRRQLDRSRYALDGSMMIGARFNPPLKPSCRRDTGPDPYDVGRGDIWSITKTGLGRDTSLWTTASLTRTDSSR
ncbi:hypothetical protein T492DRAFT_993374 [Pavlovales sp. CCMP2436]|nr:hypothetical protein T492DRAFT_993374 [Pavlovales sp. CCMP2436]